MLTSDIVIRLYCSIASDESIISANCEHFRLASPKITLSCRKKGINKYDDIRTSVHRFSIDLSFPHTADKNSNIHWPFQLSRFFSVIHTTRWTVFSCNGLQRLENCRVINVCYHSLTGCAVAQHCCKGDQSFQCETPNFDPVFPKPLNFSIPKFAQMSGIYPNVQNLVKICSQGASSPRIGEI